MVKSSEDGGMEGKEKRRQETAREQEAKCHLVWSKWYYSGTIMSLTLCFCLVCLHKTGPMTNVVVVSITKTPCSCFSAGLVLLTVSLLTHVRMSSFCETCFCLSSFLRVPLWTCWYATIGEFR